MRSEIKALQRRTHITTIFVTHDQAEALAISDQIAVMHGGVLIEVGAPHQLYTRPKRRFTATFLGLDELDQWQGAGSRRRFPARQDADQERHSKFHSRARPKEGPGRGDLDPPGKYSLAQRPSRRDWRTSLTASVTEAIFMGDSYQCKVAVGDDLVAVHTHPFNQRERWR